MSRDKQTDEFRASEFQQRVLRLQGLILRQHAWRANADVERHLVRGLACRLGMLEHSILHLRDVPPDGSPPLSIHSVEALNVALNALFLNLRGSLDNAAWALMHHWQLREDPDESRRSHRYFVHLLGQSFLAAVAARDEELSERLGELSDWGRELAELRDPAAHRIPLYVPPAVVTEEETSLVRAIDDRTGEAMKEGDWDRVHELWAERGTVGRFRHLITLPEQDSFRLGSLPRVLNRDLGNVLGALELVIAFVFASEVDPISTNGPPLPSRRLS